MQKVDRGSVAIFKAQDDVRDGPSLVLGFAVMP